jgi:hypothetical protein
LEFQKNILSQKSYRALMSIKPVTYHHFAVGAENDVEIRAALSEIGGLISPTGRKASLA